jgi:hypothetical protein
MIEEWEHHIGLERLGVIHANDSKKELGSRVDRHAHIGQGFIGPEAFRLIMTDPRMAAIPKIVETPESETKHEVNVRRLRFLAECDGPIDAEAFAALDPAAAEDAAGEAAAAESGGRPAAEKKPPATRRRAAGSSKAADESRAAGDAKALGAARSRSRRTAAAAEGEERPE